MIDQVLSRYRIIRKLGQGGMGEVYLARDERLERDVALKILPQGALADPAARERFRREALTLSQLEHPHICPVYDFDTDRGVDFLVMQHVDGETLAARIARGPLTESEIVAIGSQIAEALEAAHERGIAHRDLKPANVCLTAKGQVKVLDFGLAKLLRPAPDAATVPSLSSGMHVPGTLPYMSPEQLRGEPVDARSDVYSLGVTLYEMATGRLPYQATLSTALVDEVLHGTPPPVSRLRPGFPPRLEAAIARAMERDRTRRFQSSLEVKQSLLGEGPPAPPSDQARRARPWRRPAVVVAAVFAFAVAAVFGARWTGLRLPGGASVAEARTLLVLPLEVRGQSEGGAYVGEAFAQALAIDLAQAKELKVLPVPEASEPARGDAAARAKSAHAGHVLTGTLIRTGPSLQVNLTMLDPRENRIVWGATKEAIHADLTGLAGELAREASRHLGITATSRYDFPLYISGDPQIASAEEATGALEARQKGNSAEAIAHARRLAEQFPRSLTTQAMLGYLVLSFTTGRARPEVVGEMRDVIQRMERLDERNPYSGVFGAILLSQARGAPSEVRERLTKVLSRDDLTPALRAYALRARSHRFDAAGYLLSMDWVGPPGAPPPPTPEAERQLADLEEAVRLDPSSAWGHLYLGQQLHGVLRSGESLAQLRQAFALEPNFTARYEILGSVLLSLGRDKEAAAVLARACEISPLDVVSRALYAVALEKCGRKAEARQAAAKAGERQPSSFVNYQLARYQALTGNYDAALRLLRESVRQGFSHRRIETEAEFTPLHARPSFQALVREVAQRAEALVQAGG